MPACFEWRGRLGCRRFDACTGALASGLCATINSDDPAYFGGYLNENFQQTFAALHLSTQHAWTLAHNSIEASFAPDADKLTSSSFFAIKPCFWSGDAAGEVAADLC